MHGLDAADGHGGGSDNDDADRANASSTYNATVACREYVRDECGRDINSCAGWGDARNWRTVTEDAGKGTKGQRLVCASELEFGAIAMDDG